MDTNQTSPIQPSVTQVDNQSKPGANRMYPELDIHNNEHPNKLYAFPFVGFIIKVILCIPSFIVLMLVGLVTAIFQCINPFVILFSGRYWNPAYEISVGYLNFTTRISMYLYGLTDTYPGFNLETNGLFQLNIPKPVTPSRLMAFPLGGFIVRWILMIPYNIFIGVLQYGTYAAVLASWFAVTIQGKYPESLYEFERDKVRVNLASYIYMFYLSDTYPSFKISMHHKKVKVLLLIIGAIIFLLYTINDIQAQIHNLSHPASNDIPYQTTY